jgi:glycolate oxidase FAD binding subunit
MTPLSALQEQILHAQTAQPHRPLCLRGHGSKDFYGQTPVGDVLDLSAYQGITQYEPSELVITARAGTSLQELEDTLWAQGQMLAFEPPHFDGRGTVGGMVAAGLSGPSRACVGSVRDYVLGAVLLNHRAEVLHFGGQVMKNVAGYDVSRLLVGSMGTLGLVLEVSLKVLPLPPSTCTLRFECSEHDALLKWQHWSGQALPLNASLWHQDVLVVRLCGAKAAVISAQQQMTQSHGGQVVDPDQAQQFWHDVRHHRLAFFTNDAPLWRLSLPATSPPLHLPVSAEAQMWEWGGAQRWVHTHESAAALRQVAKAAGGHATLFRGGDKSVGVFQSLSAPLTRIHQRLKHEFDPQGLFNPGRMEFH